MARGITCACAFLVYAYVIVFTKHHTCQTPTLDTHNNEMYVCMFPLSCVIVGCRFGPLPAELPW